MKRIVFFLILCSFCVPSSFAATFAPPAGETLLFIGQDKENTAEYIRQVGVVPAGTMAYTSLKNLEGLVKPVNYGGGTQHAQWLVDQFPQSSLQIGLYLVGDLSDVESGRFDRNIKKLARWIKRSNRPVYLRIGYEFDNPENQYDPEVYKKAFRHIVELMRAKKIKNAAFVWHAHAGRPNVEYMQWYPGDTYVDWVAVSYFSPYNTDNMDQVLKIARAHDKPFMLAESSAIKSDFKGSGRSLKRWLQLAREYIAENQVEAFCYINADWDALPMHRRLQWGDARIQTYSEAKDEWLQMIQEPPFINASENHFQKIQFYSNKSKIRHRYY